MFYAGATVRSRFYGLGEVVATGQDPWVQFLDGPEMKVPGNTATVVPPEEYDRAVANVEAMERWLDLRIYGAVQPRPTLLPRKPFDLLAAMEEPVLPLPPVSTEPLGESVLYFGARETGEGLTSESTAPAGGFCGLRQSTRQKQYVLFLAGRTAITRSRMRVNDEKC